MIAAGGSSSFPIHAIQDHDLRDSGYTIERMKDDDNDDIEDDTEENDERKHNPRRYSHLGNNQAMNTSQRNTGRRRKRNENSSSTRGRNGSTSNTTNGNHEFDTTPRIFRAVVALRERQQQLGHYMDFPYLNPDDEAVGLLTYPPPPSTTRDQGR